MTPLTRGTWSNSQGREGGWRLPGPGQGGMGSDGLMGTEFQFGVIKDFRDWTVVMVTRPCERARCHCTWCYVYRAHFIQGWISSLTSRALRGPRSARWAWDARALPGLCPVLPARKALPSTSSTRSFKRLPSTCHG